MVALKVLYSDTAPFEVDMVLNEFLGDWEKEVETFDPKDLRKFLDRKDVAVGNSVLVINHMMNRPEDIIEVVAHLRPTILFYMSDERGDMSWTMALQQYTQLYLTQHNYAHYPYADNRLHIPLGYPRYYLDNAESIRPMAERSTTCAFIGMMKSDRMRMADIVRAGVPNTNIIFVHHDWILDTLPYTPSQLFTMYNDAVFVINGRGNSNQVQCFRIFEAIVAGAIPVLVATPAEMSVSMKFHSIPPVLVANSWEDAMTQCNRLLEEKETLQTMQDRLLEWWKEEMVFIKKAIHTAIVTM
jgi:hypothetical protein